MILRSRLVLFSEVKLSANAFRTEFDASPDGSDGCVSGWADIHRTDGALNVAYLFYPDTHWEEVPEWHNVTGRLVHSTDGKHETWRDPGIYNGNVITMELNCPYRIRRPTRREIEEGADMMIVERKGKP